MNEPLQELADEVGLLAPGQSQLRLAFGLSCAERIAHLLLDPRATAAIAVLRAFVEGRAGAAELEAARNEVAAVARSHPGSQSIDGAAHAAVSATHAVAHALAGRAMDAASYAAYAAVYAYSGSAVTDPSAFEGEFRWQVRELEWLASEARLRPARASASSQAAKP